MPSLQVKVLIVDYDQVLCAEVSDYLESIGNEVVFCHSCKEAKRLLASVSPDILVCEAQLDDGSGFDLHQQAEKVSIPTVFFSKETEVRNVIQALREGVSDYILKPLHDFEVIQRVLNKALKVSRLEAAQALDRKALQRLNVELMQHLRALEHDQAASRLVQMKLMPETPVNLAGVDLSYEILPSMHLSGDTIDFALFGGRYLAFYLLDVSGHGAASAFVAVWVKQIVRGFFEGARNQQRGPALNRHVPALLSLINEQLITAGVGQHLTCFVGVIDTQTREFSYVVAGHLPLPTLVTSEGARALQGTGKPIGIFCDAEWSLKSLKLPESFSISVCSDGVFDLLPKGDLDEKERCLLARINECQPRTVGDLKSIVVKSKTETLPDDVALLVLSHCC